MTDPVEALSTALLTRRAVLVRGRLDERAASDVAASLMELHALGDDGIELRLASVDAGIGAALMLIDVMAVLGVPVRTAALGALSGGDVALLAAGAPPRAIDRHATLFLSEADLDVAGRASEIERALAEHVTRQDACFAELARATARPVSEIRAEWAARRVLEAPDALSLGYADVVAAGEQPGGPMGGAKLGAGEPAALSGAWC